mmetsp:Transcript_83294/g.231141  ORF Transcript_83294/g.231141 Transcript_83294/m.231141 type:complete len:131 (+) Transcript_83294:570-962(+)
MSRADVELVTAQLRASYPDSHVLLAGDTNRVPDGLPPSQQTDPDAATIEQLVGGLGVLCRPPGPTNVRWSGEQKGSEMTFADFALWLPPPAPPAKRQPPDAEGKAPKRPKAAGSEASCDAGGSAASAGGR